MLIPKLPPPAGAAEPGPLLLRVPPLLGGIPSCGPARGERAAACPQAHAHGPQANSSTCQQIWAYPGIPGRRTGPPPPTPAPAPRPVPGPSYPPLCGPVHRRHAPCTFPRIFVCALLTTSCTRAHYLPEPSKCFQAHSEHLAFGRVGQLKQLAWCLLSIQGQTSPRCPWALLGQALPPTSTPGTREPVLRSACPPPPLGPPESLSCPRPSIHSQAKLQVPSDFASALCHSILEATLQDPADPLLFSGLPCSAGRALIGDSAVSS